MAVKEQTKPSFSTNRRGFLAGSTSLVFVLGAGGLAFAHEHDIKADDAGLESLWVKIAPDGIVTIIFPMTEMGQGSSTALPLILAEELDADWSKVKVEQLDRDDRAYGNRLFGNLLYTAGSASVAAYWEPLRLAGAQVRAHLIALAAREWETSKSKLVTEPGFVVDTATGRRLSYGELATLDDGSLSLPEITEASLKKRADFRLIGQNIERIDVADKSRGRATYAIDVLLPDMVYATVLRAPVEGETVIAIEDEEARSVDGVIDLVTLPDGVAVVAETLPAAQLARDLLTVTWSETSPFRNVSSKNTLEQYAEAAADTTHETAVWAENGDALAAIEGADTVVEREYRSDYAYHAQMEPMACVARVDDDGKGAEVWAGTQTQTNTTTTVQAVLGTTADRVRLHMMTMGGSFGRRTALMQEYVRDALLVSKTTGRPAKVVWTREDDVQNGWFRPAAVQRLKSGLASDGTIEGWNHRIATPSVIEAFNPVRWEQVKPNDIIAMRGSENRFYNFSDLRAEHVITERQARLIPWRAIGASYTSFAAEAFMDELAAEAGQDPIAFRRPLLNHNPRALNLLERVTAMSGWDGKRNNLGFSFAGYGNTMVAGVVEIDLDRLSGVITVKNAWAAVDAGIVVSPDNAHAQVEGGIIYGVSSALKERVTITDGMVDQSNFYDYEILRANEVPLIEIEFADVDATPTGLGEAGTPMVPGAIANAFYTLTGKRLRHIPFTPDRVLEALA